MKKKNCRAEKIPLEKKKKNEKQQEGGFSVFYFFGAGGGKGSLYEPDFNFMKGFFTIPFGGYFFTLVLVAGATRTVEMEGRGTFNVDSSGFVLLMVQTSDISVKG